MKELKSNLILKRVGAYLIDIFIVTLISSALAYISFINPKYDEYIKVSEKYNELLEDYYDEELTIEELTEKTQDMSYDMTKNGYVYIVGEIVIAFLYFGVFAYITKGQTLGKKLLNIKITNNKEGKNLKLYNYFIRVFILNSIILNIITLIAACFKKSTYYNIYSFGANLDTIIILVIFIMVLFRKDGRGLHDILASTKVIDLKEEQQVLVPEATEDKEKVDK